MRIWDTFENWWPPLAAAVVAVLAALLAYQIAKPVMVRLTRHLPITSAITARLHAPLRWVLPLLALQAAWAGASDDLRGIELVRHLNLVLLIAAVTAAAIGVVRGISDAIQRLHPQDVADNLNARRILTQTRVLSRIAVGALLFAGLAFVLMTFPRARQFGTSLLASAGLSALVIGVAARSVLSNLLAGLQIALSQPIRIDDVLIIEGEWGRVEEITGTYVVLKIWDERRLVVPLQWFIEHPFQNWTRTSAQIIGSVFLWVDYTVQLEPLRQEAQRLANDSKDFDGRVCLLQVVETTDRALQLRLIVSSPSAGQSWDLRCLLREGLVAYLQREQPHALPRVRADVEQRPQQPAGDGAAADASGPALAARLRGGRFDAGSGSAAVNDDTGLASLTAPTGGLVAPPDMPPVPPLVPASAR